MIHDDLGDLEQRGWDALSSTGEAARAFYADVLDDQPIMLLPGGILLDERSRIIESVSGRPWSSYVLQDLRTTELTPEAAIVTYGAVAERDGETYSALMSSVYVRRGDGWKLAFHQQTPR
jgi:hypothetical protein